MNDLKEKNIEKEKEIEKDRDKDKEKTKKGDPKIAERIKTIRTHLGLTQSELATKLGVGNTTLSDLEAGKYNPSHEFYESMMRIFNVNLYYLFLGEDPMFRTGKGIINLNDHLFIFKPEELEEFLYYFKNSTLIQLTIMTAYKTARIENHNLIQKDLEKLKE